MELKQYQGALEAILFAHGEPIGTDRLAPVSYTHLGPHTGRPGFRNGPAIAC